MYYSAIGVLAVLVLLFENKDLLLNRIGGFDLPAWRMYRRFLIAVLIYYLTDIAWGWFEAEKWASLLFADTTVYFIAMAAGVFLWTHTAVVYLGVKDRFSQLLMHAGRIFAVVVTILSILNCFMPVLFTVDDACVYRALDTRYVILISQIVLLLLVSGYAFITMARLRRTNTKAHRYRTLGFYGLITGVFLTIQLWYPYLPLYTVAYMLGTTLLRAFVVGDEEQEYQSRLEKAENARMLEERIAYTRVSALSGDYIAMFVVDPENGRYRECSSSSMFESFALAEEGEDFFSRTRELSPVYTYPEDLEHFLNAFTRENVLTEIEHRGLFTVTYRLMTGGKPRYVQLKVAMVDEQEGRCLIAGINDIDAQMKQEAEYRKRLAQAQNQANVDALTGVRNRHAYLMAEEKLNRRITEGSVTEFAVSILDVNDLKKVNDTSGHQAGDQYLRSACMTICRTFKHSPVFRIGGDEFAVLSQDEDYEHLDELTALISTHNEEAIRSGGVVIACGTARFREGDKYVADVFERADQVMYDNKNILKAAEDKQGE